MNEQTYNDAKWTAFVLIPLFSSFYFLVDLIAGLPGTKYVCGFSAMVALLFGTAVMLASRRDRQYDGEIVISRRQNGSSFSLELEGDPYDLEKKETVIFKIVLDPSEE